MRRRKTIIMTLDISDLYDAFLTNYHILQLQPDDNNTT